MSDDQLGFRNESEMALKIVDHIPAIVAYWDATEICQFANAAYLRWFGKTRDQLVGTSLAALLGASYATYAAHIRLALAGEPQVFERQFPALDGPGLRDGIVTYTPDCRDGVVHGMFTHVSDSTQLMQRERELALAVAERDRALAAVRELRGLLPICASCKRIRDTDGEWIQMERYVQDRTNAEFSHGVCPECLQRLYPSLGWRELLR